MRGFILREQVISYFSHRAKSYVAVAKHPIPSEAVIPKDDIDNGRLTLKLWPPEHLPVSLVVDLDCEVEREPSFAYKRISCTTNGPLDNSARSVVECSVANRAGELPSMSSCTSYGKEPIYENTIEQILGNIERSNLGELKDQSHESHTDWRRYSRHLVAPALSYANQ